jgi:hypothetical protein
MTLRFDLLNEGMTVLEGYDLPTTASNTYFYINRDTNDVRFLRVAGPFIAIDDLQFDTRSVSATPANPIPEPSSVALTLVGGARVFLARRRLSA